MNTCKSNTKGLTLVELIITLAILSLVLTGIYSLFGFGNNTFARGTRQSDIQSSIRLASDYITQQIRYSTETRIMDDSDIPAITSIQPYENYIYFDSISNAITHINKYFTKTIPIGHSGAIEFKSLTPYKLLTFNIQAQNRGQTYNISSEVISMNLHLSAGGAIGGTTGDAAPASERDAIYFKTATDYLAIQLRPIAQFGGINAENQLEVNYDRDIIDVDILSSVGVTDPQIAISIGARTVVLTSSAAIDGSQIVFRVTFGGTEAYGNTYDYTVKYTDATKWEMQ